MVSAMRFPHVLKHPPARALAVGAAAFFAAAGSAQAACPVTPTTKAFAKIGDLADYTLAPGGNFESGASGWSLGGASVVAGNEPLFLGSPFDKRSLAVPAQARAVSPAFCVGVEHPTFRLTARMTGGSWGSLAVKLRWTESSGRVNETTVASLDGAGYRTWKPTPTITLAPTLPLWASGQSLKVQVVLDPEDFGGAWQVDDLYIDPYRRS